jgi:hypothetical protein
MHFQKEWEDSTVMLTSMQEKLLRKKLYSILIQVATYFALLWCRYPVPQEYCQQRSLQWACQCTDAHHKSFLRNPLASANHNTDRNT